MNYTQFFKIAQVSEKTLVVGVNIGLLFTPTPIIKIADVMTIMPGHRLKLFLVLAVACAQRRLRLLDTHSLHLSATNELCSDCHRYIPHGNTCLL